MNVGILGSGFIVPEFIKATQALGGFHLRAIWGRHREKIEAFEGFDYYSTDINEILNDKEIDVVYIGLPNGLHYQYAKMCLEAGKNVICEKPFTANYRDAKDLIDYAKEHDLIIFEAIMTKHNHNYKAMCQEIDKLGEIKLVDCNFSQYSRRYDRFKNGEILPVFDKNLAGGALMDLSVYNIHFVVGIFGVPEKVQYYPNMECGVDTSGILIMEYPTFKAVCIAGKDCQSDGYCRVQGTKGYLRVDTCSSVCEDWALCLNKQEPVRHPGAYVEFAGWEDEMTEFKKLYENKDLKLAQEYNQTTLQVMEVIDKALKSAGIEY